MKKSLLLLFSLLIFVGNVWGDYTFTYPNKVTVGTSSTYTFNLGGTYAIGSVSMEVRSQGYAALGRDFVITTSGGTEIYNNRPTYSTHNGKCIREKWGICWEYEQIDDYDNIQKSVNSGISSISFKNEATGNDRYFRNLSISVLTINLESFGNAEAGTTSSVTRSFNVLSTSTPTVVCPTGFSATVQKGNGYSYTVTVSFSPTAVQPYSGNITMGGQVVATVSGVGTPQVPSDLNATEEFLQSTLSWNGASVSYYQVYNGSTLLYKGTNKSYTWTGLQWGNSYTFSVQACTAENTNCSNSASKTFNTKTLLAPTGVSVSNIGYDNATVTWNVADGASLYRVYLSSDNGSTYTKYGSDVMATSERKMPISGLTPGKKYYVKVESALNGKETSRTDSKDFTTTAINVPQNVTCTPDYLSATLTWDAVSDKSNYGVVKDGVKYYYAVYKDNVWVADTQSEQYTIENLQWGDNNCGSYTVKTYAFSTTSDASNACNVNTKTLLAPTGVSVSNIGYDNATVTWNAADGATSYKIYVDGLAAAEVTGTTYSMTGLSLGDNHNVKVESILDDKETTTAQAVNFSTNDLVAPASVVADQENTSYSSVPLSWSTVTDATGYVIINNVTGSTVAVNGGSTNSYVMTGLEMKTNYTFTVYPTYNGLRSKNSKVSNSVKTKNIDVPLSDCMIFENTNEIKFLMSAGEYYYPNDNGYVISDSRRTHTQKLTFEIKKALGYVGSVYDVRLYIKVGNSWQSSYIWNGNDFWTNGSSVLSPDYAAIDYQTVTVTLPKNVTAIRFKGSAFSGWYKDWAKYGGNERYIKNVRVYMGAEAIASPTTLEYDPYIGQEQTKSYSFTYANRADVIFSNDNPLFYTEFPSLTSCTKGNTTINVKFKPETLDTPVQGSITMFNGEAAAVALSATVKELPAPTPFEVSGTAPASITLTWGDVNITETGYKVVCKQGETEIETKNLGGDVTTCTFEGLTPNVEYTFTITTMYNTIENGSATIPGSTTQLPAPQNFNITNVLSARADASWNEVASATGYRLTWTDGADSNGSVDLDSDVLNYVITDLIPNIEYTATVATLYDGNVHGTSDEQTFTTSCVVRTAASGDEVKYQSHNIEFISGTQLADGSYLKGSVIRYTSSTSSENIRFVQINVDGTIYTTPSIEITINGNVHIESRYEYKGIAEVIDDKVYDTLNEAVEAVHDGGTINLLGDVPTQDLSVSGKHIEFNGNGHSISNLYIESDGSVDLIGDVVVVNDFGLEISTSNSGQFTQTNAQIEVRGKAYVDKAFDASGVGSADKWYSLAVPFRVSMANGMAKIVNGVESHAGQGKDIDIFVYDSEKRARTTGKLDSWVYMSANGTLEPATFYLVGITHSGPNVFRFYKDDNADLVTLNKEIELHEYPSSIQKNAGWNGIGNSQLYHVGITLASTGYAQILENNKFITIDLGESSFAVTSPMFIQSATDSKATLNYKNDGSLRSASATSATYNVRLTPEGADKYSDQMFVNASSDVTGEYRIGKDLAKFELSTSAPQIYTKAYETTLSVHEAGYNAEGYADIDLFMFAPTAGNYTLSLGKDVSDGSTLYLVKDGSAIHNFNEDGAYILYLAKGTNSSYTLRIANGTEDVPTEVTEDTESAVKVFIKEHVLHICDLPSGEDYMVGNLTRTLYTGTSNGSTIEIPLTMQGVYWIRLEDSTIKVLNK